MKEPRPSVWAEYRKWRKIFWWSIPAAVLVVIISGGNTGAAFMGGFLLIMGVNLFQSFKCPSCGDCFFYDRYCKPTTKCCVHCRFPKWAEPAPGYGPPSKERLRLPPKR